MIIWEYVRMMCEGVRKGLWLYESMWEWCVRICGRDYDYMRECENDVWGCEEGIMIIWEYVRMMRERVRKGLWLYESMWEWCVRVWGRDYDYMRVCENDVWGCEEGIMIIWEYVRMMCEGVKKGLWLYERVYNGIWEWHVRVWGMDYDYMRVTVNSKQ